MLSSQATWQPESLAGTVLDGRYRLVAHAASGGMGAIFRAEHVYMRKELALKVLRPELSTLPDIAERFRREAEIVASLEHDNIVRVTDFGRSPEGWLFLVMELLSGESLFERLRRCGALSPQEAIHILVQVCRGLEAAHERGVVHRDLKPENIFLAERPPGAVKLLDFGIAKLTDPTAVGDTQDGVVVGTPEYLSPEQAAGSQVDCRADLYATGLIAWRMLAGRHPFRADDARGLLMMQATQPVPPLTSARPELASWPRLVAAIARACAKEPAARQASAAELRADLEASVGPVAVSQTTPSGRERALAALSLPTPPTGGSDTLTLPGRSLGPATWGPRALRLLGAHWRWLALAAVAGLLATGSPTVKRWMEERPFVRAQRLLATDHPEAAREVVALAMATRPTDARLRVLEGRALHRIEGQAAAGVTAYAGAYQLDPRSLDVHALADLVADLSREPSLAASASQLLVRVGPRSLPALIAGTRAEKGAGRLRSLELARAMGADRQVDWIAGYSALLKDESCDVRRTAARRLGELGDRGALPWLQDLAQDTRRMKGLFGAQVPVCGATEADAAIERIKAGKR